jgi:uncharacterized membrane protein
MRKGFFVLFPAGSIVFRIMQRVAFNNLELRPRRLSRWPRVARRVLFGLFLVAIAFVWARLFMPSVLLPNARWPEGVLLVLAAATLLASLTRELPGQNIILASVLIGVIAGGVHTLGTVSGIPFGPYVYTEEIGQQLFYPLPWAVPGIWLIAVLSCRGVARLILRPWRKGRNYGFWLIGVTVLLITLFDLALEPYAVVVKRFWEWKPTKVPVDWYGAPVTNLLGWALTASLMMVLTTPALIKRKPVKLPPDYRPLLIWALINGFFIAGAAVHHLWSAAILTGVISVVAGLFALWGARTEKRSSADDAELESGGGPKQ